MKIVKYVVLILILGLEYTASAYTIKKIGIDEGLSNNNIVGIAQDRDGFMWVGTKDGLNRLDGNSIKVFKKRENDVNSLISNKLNHIYADQTEDILWVATERNGLVSYNYKTHVFEHFEHNYDTRDTNSISGNGITHITSDTLGNLWLASYGTGIDCYNKKTGRFTNYNQSNVKGLVTNYNWCSWYENEERIYVGHVNEGLSIVNTTTRSAQNFRFNPDDPSSLPDNTVNCIFKDSKGNVWIGTRNGLALMDATTLKITRFTHASGNERSLSSNLVESIMESNDSMLWVGTEGGGVNILNLNTLVKNPQPAEIQFDHILEAETPDGLSSSSVQSIFQDSYGNFWMGGYIGGINFIRKEASFFKQINYLPIIGYNKSLNNKSVLGLCTDSDDNLWIANDQGGICIFRENIKVREITHFGNESTPLTVRNVYKDSDGNIWIGTLDSRILKYVFKTDQIIELKCFDQIKNVPILSFFEDSKRNMWVSTDVGLLKYNLNTEQCFMYTDQNSQLSDNVIRAVEEDEMGNIWVGTLLGSLRVFDPNFNLLLDHSQQNNFFSISDIYKDSNNRMWICSINDLFLFENCQQKSAERFGTDEGLSESDIRSVVEGKSANEMWLSMNNGIAHINLQTKMVNNFYKIDGIVMGDYVPASMTKTSDGTIYFGSQKGITYFNQNFQETGGGIKVKSAIAGFLAPSFTHRSLNEFVGIPFSKKMILDHTQNSFQIQLTTMNFALKDRVEFMFQMQGLDNNWYLINNEKQVTFRNLAPGNYTFNLKTRLHNKEWTSEITSMKITINPPLWLTWQAKMIYSFLTILMFFLVLTFNKKKIKIQNDLLFEKKSRQQEHELNEDKIKFFTNITHELRTPMTLLLGPLEDLVLDKTIPESAAKKINSMHRVANRLLQLINQLLEFRKTESKNRELTLVKGDIGKFIYEIGLKYKELNRNENIDFEIKLPQKKVEILYDSEVVALILDNLLSNAIKYTAQGAVHLELRNYAENDVEYTEIEVSDTGYGIAEDDLTHIFNRYYQAKNTAYTVSGTGIGLALVKNLVELHEAEIRVDSALNVGSSFKVRFVTHNSYPGVKQVPLKAEQLDEDEEINNSKNVVLVVDDNREITDYIYDSLIDAYQVITASNGKEGFEVACDKVPDMVISDVMMPVMGGIEMCKMLKEDVRTCHIPIILLTAKGSLQDKSEGYDAGADSYLTKPFSGSLLKSRLKNLVDTRKTLTDSYTKIFNDKKQFFKDSTNQLDRDFLDKLTKVIEKNLEDEEMNISQIASEMNMSHSTLYRKIKALTELTANEYIRKVRMKVAEELLISNKYTISEIMYQIGINSKSYFRQCFKDEFGISTSEYLKNLKE